MNGLPEISFGRKVAIFLLLGNVLGFSAGCLSSRSSRDSEFPAHTASTWVHEEKPVESTGFWSKLRKPSKKTADSAEEAPRPSYWDSDVEEVKAREAMKAQPAARVKPAAAVAQAPEHEAPALPPAVKKAPREAKPSFFSRLFPSRPKPAAEPVAQIAPRKVVPAEELPQPATEPVKIAPTRAKPGLFSRLTTPKAQPQVAPRVQRETPAVAQNVVVAPVSAPAPVQEQQAAVEKVAPAPKQPSFLSRLVTRQPKTAESAPSQPSVRRVQPAAAASVEEPPVAVKSAQAGAGSSIKSEIVMLRPGLTLSVTVLVSGKKEVEEALRRISDKGVIELPFLGSVNVTGMEASALSAHLVSLYKAYFVDPQVLVDFAKDDKVDGVSPWGFVTVLGRVKKPGRIAIPPTRDLTVSGAIQKADGFDTSARQTAIRITRRLPDGTTDTREVDLYSVGARGKFKEDLVLQPEDVVFVPEQIF